MTAPAPETSDTALTDAISVGPDIDAESWRLVVPGRAACYVLEDAEGMPIIIANVGDLRGALMRRLGPDAVAEDDETTRRKIDYRAVTRRVRWRPVFSRFEGDRVYLENVRELFPGSYRKLIRGWRAWWVSVDPAEAHPRFNTSDRPMGPAPFCFGPFPSNKLARRHVEMLEDLFDLCRYPHILAQAPNGEACAYKQMGRCPAPCDGTIPMDDYREQIAAAVKLLVEGPDAWRADITAKMKAAAAERAFEQAARYKAMLDASRHCDDPKLVHVGPLTDFRFVSLQPGDRKGRVRVYLIAPDSIEYAGQVEKTNRDELIPQIAARIDGLREAPVRSVTTDSSAAERIGLVSWHLVHADRDRGAFHRVGGLPDVEAIASAIDAFNDRDEVSPDDGVTESD